MNKLSKYPLFLLFTALASCSSDDDALPTPHPVAPPSGDALALTVSARDFMTDGAPDTRATDNGRVTTFENNDCVGIIILDKDAKPLYNNIPYKYVSSSQTWVFDSNNGEGKEICYYDSKARTYIVYYPYNKDADNCKGENDLKAIFKPKTDQSAKDAYRASDLMVSTTTPLAPLKSLTAELKHVYASISLAPTAYTLDDGNNTKCNAKVSDANLTIGDNLYVPYQATDGSLRCIVPTDITPSGIRCFYTFSGTTYGNEISIATVAANTRYTSEPEIISEKYTLADARVGDFYCKNSDNKGYLIPGDVALTDDQKNACVGIVFWEGDATQRDKTLKNDYEHCTHGLVVALKDVEGGTSVWQNLYISVQSWLNNNKSGVYLSVASGTGSSEPLNNIQGYNNTKAIEEFNAAPANSGNLVQAVVKVNDYRKKVLAPNNSSQWYLPSEKELTLLCGKDVADIWSNNSGGTTANKDLINSKLSSINSVATTILSAYYWSSTEDSSYSGLAFRVSFDYGGVGTSRKDYAVRVRCVLAF